MTSRPERPATRLSEPATVQAIDAALTAFAHDVSYTAAMAHAAVVITGKRAMWAARRQLRDAEEHAHQQCRPLSFDCHAVSACGTGDCKFAAGPHAQLTVPAGPGEHRRPQYPHHGYRLDEAITALANRHEHTR